MKQKLKNIFNQLDTKTLFLSASILVAATMLTFKDSVNDIADNLFADDETEMPLENDGSLDLEPHTTPAPAPAPFVDKRSIEKQRLSAVHEAGHAIVGLALKNELKRTLKNITIIPDRKKGSGGTTIFGHENYLGDGEAYEAFIAMYYGGRAAEVLILGKKFDGSSADIKNATSTAVNMVFDYGISDLGPINYNYYEFEDGEIMAVLNKEVTRILEEQYGVALGIVGKHRDKVEKLAAVLMEEKTLSPEQVYEIVCFDPKTATFIDQTMSSAPNHTLN
ncbi:MAG: hypothetical protein AAF182_03290 [Pseudomonadota bacterium]